MSQEWDDSSAEDRPEPGPAETPEIQPRFWCPGCDEEIQVSPETIGQLVRCPYCSTDFFASDEHSHLPIVDDTPDHPVDRENELDTSRVRKLSARRMSIVRMASWYLIGLLISIWAVVAFTVKAILIASEDHYWGVWPTVCMVFVSGAVWVARRCRRALKNARIEIAQHAMPEPETPPDFSTLNNGRDRWKELEHIR